MKTPEEMIKEKYPFYDENYTDKDVELGGKQVTELMIKYADQFKQVKVEPEVILPKANPQVFTLADLEKAYNDGYKNGIMNEAGLECEPFDVWYNWVHVIKSKNRSEA